MRMYKGEELLPGSQYPYPAFSTMLNIEYVSNETNTDVHMYISRIYSSRDLDTLLHKVEVLNEYIGKYTGIYTHVTIA